MNLAMDLWHSNDMKVILRKFAKDHCFWTLWTLNYVDCIPFSSLILSMWLTFSNLHFCGRRPVKLALFVRPSASLSVRLWHIFLRIYSLGFLNFLLEHISPYILDFGKLYLLSKYLGNWDKFGPKGEYLVF